VVGGAPEALDGELALLEAHRQVFLGDPRQVGEDQEILAPLVDIHGRRDGEGARACVVLAVLGHGFLSRVIQLEPRWYGLWIRWSWAESR
jgi:hypothetical protein